MKSDEMTENLRLLKKKNIYFGHQSVGNNILDGMEIIIRENSLTDFNIIKLENIDKRDQFYFAHSKIGINGNPKKKVDDFCKTVEKLSDKNLDLAMMKLCYADINRNSNIEEIFKYYTDKIDRIKQEYPGIRIINFTVPLTVEKSWWQKIKENIGGNTNAGQLDNLMRIRFNKLLLSKYPDSFDLARIESTNPDGIQDISLIDGEECYYMISGFSDDGGHLNESGKRIIAEKLMKFLVIISSQS